jgi:hypothetical protein
MRLALCFSILLLALGGCKKSAGSHSALRESANASPNGAGSGGPKLDACALLTREEIQAVQGSAITDAKGSDGVNGAFPVSQCYFAAAESSKSVSLAITQSSPGSKNSPRDYWNETFGRFRDGEKAKEKEEEEQAKESDPTTRKKEEEEVRPPKKIEGIGEEAFWSGNRFGGALYVLKKENIIRVSVGGPDNEETKINKSKALAEKAMTRL